MADASIISDQAYNFGRIDARTNETSAPRYLLEQA